MPQLAVTKYLPASRLCQPEDFFLQTQYVLGTEVILQTIIKPVLLRFKADQDSGRLSMASYPKRCIRNALGIQKGIWNSPQVNSNG